MFLCSMAKASHWETEKAEYKNARHKAQYGVSHKTCFDVISNKRDIIFLFALFFSVFTNCDSSQKNSAVVIFLNYHGFFICRVKVGEKRERV